MQNDILKSGDLIKTPIKQLFHVISMDPWEAEWVDRDTYERTSGTGYSRETIESMLKDDGWRIVDNIGKSRKAMDFYNRIK